MGKWDGTILDINATVKALGEKCQGLMGMHSLSGWDQADANMMLHMYSNACSSSDHVEIRGSPFAETIDITQFGCEVTKGGRGYHDHCFHRESCSSKCA